MKEVLPDMDMAIDKCKTIGKKLGLDVEKVKSAVADNKYKSVIAANQELAGDMNASGTPHFFINGRRLVGAQPFPAFKTIIEEEIKKAEALVKKGVKVEDLYAELIKNGKEPPPPERKEVGAAPKDAPFKGAKDAKVVIHEFSDFQCPYCSRVNKTIKQVMANYGDKVKIVWRHKPLPFHKDAPLASEAAIEAHKQKGNDGFWAMHDKLFANQRALMPDNLKTYAAELGLDTKKFNACLDDEKHRASVDNDMKEGQSAGVSGTPAFFVNGRFVSGAVPYETIKALIDEELELKGITPKG